MARIGILPLGRATFDVAYAGEKLAAMLAALDASGHDIIGPRELLFDADATRAAFHALEAEGIDRLLILQVTFTDAAMTVEAANRFAQPLAIWAMPEPRLGGRLRLNAFCGLNLASHALGLAGRSFGWLYADAEGADVAGLLDGSRDVRAVTAQVSDSDPGQGAKIARRLKGKRIGRVGVHPDGFDTCAYDPARLVSLAGVEVEPIDLRVLFDTARAANADETASLKAHAAELLPDLGEVDQIELDKSLRLKLGLDRLRRDRNLDAFAIRCWPETFTEYGGAVCGPVSMLGEARVPCACEADVYGALTQMLLQEVVNAPVFLVDLVDMDTSDDTGVVWHCGQAPMSMADPDCVPSATIHTNRKMPLLFEFPLKPGRVTFARISQARGAQSLVIATGEMLKRRMAFTGTSGVVRFDGGAGAALDRVIGAGLEHHMGLVYGDHADTLRSVASAMGLPVVEL